MMDRVETGSRALDAALAGGLPHGSALLVTGEEGAGGTEFVMAFLRHAIGGKAGHRARFLSALRSPKRVLDEYGALFEDTSASAGLEVMKMFPEKVRAAPAEALEGLVSGDMLILESANALAPPGDGYSVPPFWRDLADAAGERGVIAVLLHSPGTLPPAVEASLAEAADGVMHFSWQSSGSMRRRSLALVKLRGLAPGMDGGEVPLFEVALSRGVGFTISRGRNVI